MGVIATWSASRYDRRKDFELEGGFILEVRLDLDDGVVGTDRLGGLELQAQEVVRERTRFRLRGLDVRPARRQLLQGERGGGSDVDDAGVRYRLPGLHGT